MTILKLIHPTSKKHQVVSSMREAILTGRMEPGDAIVESRIAKELGTGIPLVREALIELEHQGFVEKTRYKGTTVTKLGPSQVQQIFRLRVELEGLAIKWACEHINRESIEELRGLIRTMKCAAADLDLGTFYESDLALHRKIWQRADNPYLADALERNVVPLFAFFVMKTKRERDAYITSAAEHARLVEGLEKLNAEEMQELMRDSLQNWQRDMQRLVFTKEQ